MLAIKSFRIEEDIKVFKYGNPIETGTIVADMVEVDFENDINVLFKDKKCNIRIDIESDDVVYGLGANLGGINKRGRLYESYCTDEPHHTEDKIKLYSAHNFFIISGKESRGYFIDFPSRIKYDIGFYDINTINVEIFGQDFYLYIIEGETTQEIVSKFLKIIGKAYVPPKWGFGYFQSRWGYRDKEAVMQIYNRFKENNIPIDGIYLDLDYMENFKDFSLSEERFSDFEEFVAELKEKGVYLIPIIDAGVKVEEGYDIYEEGINGGHFCKDKDGKPYVAGVWPGKVHFPDFLKEDTQIWFGSKYKFLTDFGIEGVWNDMNEPAIFYDEKSLNEAIDAAIEAKGKNLEVYAFFGLKDKFSYLANKDEYYRSFYHEIDGKLVSNEEVHNLYGYYMTKSANIGLKSLLENKRFVLISRASSIGMHRYGGIWTGDNSSWWPHLELNIKMMPSINMCGFFYTGADTGGFGSNCNGELLVRWLQFSVFTPLLRNHSAVGCNNQEPFSFGKEIMEISKKMIEARYRLIPYIYSEYMKAVNNYRLMFKPMSFEYEGEFIKEIEDQLLFGNELMITPVYKSSHKGRLVYLPEDMAEVSFGEEDIYVEVKKEGIQYLKYNLDEFKFYLRKNSLVPYIKPSMNVKNMDQSDLQILAYVDDKAEYELYDDDGITYDFEKGKSYSTIISIIREKDDYKIDVNNQNPSIKTISFKIFDSKNNVWTKKILL